METMSNWSMIGYLTGVLGLVALAYSLWRTIRNSGKKETELAMDVKYIKNNLERFERSGETRQNSINDHERRLFSVEREVNNIGCDVKQINKVLVEHFKDVPVQGR